MREVVGSSGTLPRGAQPSEPASAVAELLPLAAVVLGGGKENDTLARVQT